MHLLLGRLALGYVAAQRDQTVNRALAIAYRKQRNSETAGLGRKLNPVLAGKLASLLNAFAKERQAELRERGRDGVLKKLSLGLGFGDIADFFRNRVHVGKTETAILGDIEQREGIRDIVENLPVFLLAFLQVMKRQEARQRVRQPPADHFKKLLLFLCPDSFARALVKRE